MPCKKGSVSGQGLGSLPGPPHSPFLPEVSPAIRGCSSWTPGLGELWWRVRGLRDPSLGLVGDVVLVQVWPITGVPGQRKGRKASPCVGPGLLMPPQFSRDYYLLLMSWSCYLLLKTQGAPWEGLAGGELTFRWT